MAATLESVDSATYSARNTALWAVLRGFLRNGGLADAEIGWIRPSSLNPRKHFDEAALAELAASIQAHGLLEPLVCREIEEGADSYLEIVCGERRYRAAQLAGLEKLPVRSLGVVDDKAAR